jgi:hypothetical protein
MSDEEVKVGNINKATKKPLPGKAGKAEKTEATVTTEATGTSDEGIAELNAKMTKLIELAQAIDWKMWVYLKANNYID